MAEYRVKDTINFGYGVMITYELRGSKEETSAAATTEALKLDLKGSEKLVCGILDAMREEMVGEWDVGKKQKGFMELGLDSLDVVQLVAKINDKTGLNLPQTVVFDKPNAQAPPPRTQRPTPATTTLARHRTAAHTRDAHPLPVTAQ